MTKELEPNTTLSHYRIVSKIGAGGMGEVYLAQDTKLDRKVALKILPADVATSRDRMERFVREAKSAAALNHPNIAHIYEIGESDGTHYIAMEFIDGQTLRDKIHRDKAPLPQLLKYLIQVAQGLSKAHAAGIVHRDLKPDNIMITRDDYAKVLDFGLAKLVEPERTFGYNESGSSEIATAVMQQPGWDSGHSTPGMVIGTIGYMSPEQASGHVDEIDLRSDIFSFGCILFEAATGQRAFAGKDVLDSLHKIVHAPTPQLKDANPLAPAELQRVVRRCLAKEREKRYQSIKELAIELEDLQQELKGFTESEYSGYPIPATSASTSGVMRGDEGFRIAVLPFKVRDADPDVGVLADGLSEEIVTGLSRFRYLSVVTSTSAARLRVETEDEGSLAAKRGTRYVLEGSIRKGGTVIRVSAQVLDTETGAQLWSESYSRDLQKSTVFAVQDDIAGRIVATVADSYGVLVHSMRAAIRKKDDADLSPAEWQFQYFAYREQITPSAHAALKSRLLRVAEQNDGQSDLWACLAQIYVDEYAFGFQGDATSLDRALAAGRRAVELDRANQFALVALAQVHFFRQDLAAFGPAAERAMALNPLNTDALGILGLEIVHTAEFQRGTAIVRHAMELNPNHAGWMHFAPLWDHFNKGEYERALECANRVDVPGLFWPFLVMASACGHLGRRAEAEAAVKDLLSLDPEFAAHVRPNIESWHFASGLMDPILEGLRKAGLEISDEAPAASSSATPLASSETRADEGFWVAVLPFRYSGANADLVALAEGLSEEIVTGLSRFSYLRVISRSSTLRYESETEDGRTVGKPLGARYVMEGSLRLAGSMLRLSVQLVDTSTGAHLWAETYNRQFNAEEVFALQDDLVPRIVSTIADGNGVLPRSMSEVVCSKNPDELSPYEAVLRSFRYFDRVTAEELTSARTSLELAVEKAPTNADAWAMLALLCCQDYGQGFNLQSDSLNRGTIAAQRAVEAAPSNHLAHFSLAQARFFQKELQSFRNAAERAVALNPMDANSLAFMGELLTYVGDWERGLALASRAKQINPNHPGWFWYADFFHAYRQGDYRGALALVLKANLPGHWGMHAGIAASAGQLGDHEAAGKAIRDLLKLRPDFCTAIPNELKKWFDPEFRKNLIEGLRKAGLEIAEEESGERQVSTESRADEGFWVAVLPFEFAGPAELATLADGLSEEIVRGLSRFSYLRVIARSSTLRFASESPDVRTVGKRLGARYVLEGSVRQAGAAIRVSVQLVDASTGAHLWAETYNRSFKPEDIFALQDDLVPRIVSTVADQHGVLPHSMSEEIRTRDPEQLTPYETVLRGFRYYEGVTAAEHAALRATLERAMERGPANADCWAMLSIMYCDEHKFGFNPLPDSLGRARAAAQRAVEISPTNPFAYEALSQALFFRKEFDSFRNAAERAIALNPMDGATNAFMGILIAFTGDWDYGCAVAERATQLNPHHPGWYWNAAFYNAYRKFDYEGALKITLEFNMPGLFYHHVNRAAVYGQLGEREAASQALAELLALKPDFANTGRAELGKWLRPEFVEHVIDGLRKAGLEISEATSVAITEPRNSIAVLPFTNLSANPENEYFCDGLAEELLNALAKIDRLKVAARTSTFSFKGKNAPVSEIAKALNVNTIMEGSVRKSGNRVRITAQVINAADGYHLWSERYDRELKDIFDVQDEITLAVVEALKVKLFGQEQAAVLKRHTRNPEAHEFYLRGLSYFMRWTPEFFQKAIKSFDQAIAIDPRYASAYAGLAECYTEMSFFAAAREWMPKAREAARQALELDDTLGNAHNSLAVIKMYYDRDYAAAEHEFRRAIALDPGSAHIHNWYGWYLGLMGRFDESSKEMKRAQELDPLSALIDFGVGAIFHWSRKPAQAIEHYQRVLELNPQFSIAYWFLTDAYVEKGDFASAIATIENAPITQNDPVTLSAAGHAYGKAGERGRAREILSELEKQSSPEYEPAFHIAQVYLGLGDYEQALRLLERACDERSVWLIWLGVDPKFDPLRSDPRFEDLLRRVGLPHSLDN